MAKKDEDHHHLLNNKTTPYVEEDDESVPRYSAEPKSQAYILSRRWVNLFVSLIFFPTLLVNCILSLALYHSKTAGSTTQPLSQYAGLPYILDAWKPHNQFTGDNLTAIDQTWKDVDIDYGLVTLSKAEIKSLGLPPSLKFPWDPEGHSIYILTSVHSMHCLKIIHRSNLEYRMSHPQTYHVNHIMHCLDNLRTDLMCAADDTPRYIPVDVHASPLHPPQMLSEGQERQCRNWKQLETWAKEHSSCFSYNEELILHLAKESPLSAFPAIHQYCTQDSIWMPKVREYFGMGMDWTPIKPGFPENFKAVKVDYA